MCKLSNLFVVDLYSDSAAGGTGGISWNVANSLPQLMNQPCKIVVKQVQTEIVDPAITIENKVWFRVVHNMNIQSGTNYNGFSNSNTLCFFDIYKTRATVSTTHFSSSTETQNKLFAPQGLPAILNLNRYGATNANPPVDSNQDKVELSWCIRLEITVNPDQE
jgi:hypothetical protein